jgi:hypothetical protein
MGASMKKITTAMIAQLVSSNRAGSPFDELLRLYMKKQRQAEEALFMERIVSACLEVGLEPKEISPVENGVALMATRGDERWHMRIGAAMSGGFLACARGERPSPPYEWPCDGLTSATCCSSDPLAALKGAVRKAIDSWR